MECFPEILALYFDNDVSSCPRSDVQNFAITAAKDSLLKKYEGSSGTDADSIAISKFLQSNSDCRDWALKGEHPLFDRLDSILKHRLSRFDCTFPESVGEINSAYCFGPGASHGVSGSSIVHKLNDTCTATSTAVYGYYIQHVRHDRNWIAAERLRSRSSRKIVVGNKLQCVPKTNESSRVICIEPSCNMFLQQGLKAELENLLKLIFGINLENQQFLNRDMARQGSVDGGFSTIDLSSASDSISVGFCREFLPALLFESLMFVRSPIVRVGSSQHELHMISSAGNATTFPLESIIFSSILLSVYDLLGIKIEHNVRTGTDVMPGNFGCFGDDLICVPEAFHFLLEALNRYGFVVNVKKTFHGYSRFRESCGGDYYNGRNVRGVYLKRLGSEQDLYSVLNRLLVWSARHCIDIPQTIAYLLSCLKNVCFVPPFHQLDEGLKVPLSFMRQTRDPSIQGYVYRHLSICARSVVIEKIKTDKLKRLKLTRAPSPSVILVGALQGTARGGRLLTGGSTVSQAWSSTSVWDSLSDSASFFEDVSFSGWETALTTQLLSNFS